MIPSHKLQPASEKIHEQGRACDFLHLLDRACEFFHKPTGQRTIKTQASISHHSHVFKPYTVFMTKVTTYYPAGQTETFLRHPVASVIKSHLLMGFEWKGSRLFLGNVSVEIAPA